MSRSVDTNYLNSPFSTATALGIENASFDSIRTDLSANSKDVIIGEQWVVLGRIGEGSFGEVFEGEDIDTGRHYAIKREPLDIPHPQLKHESVVYDVLAGGPGIPQCHWHGQHEEFDCLVIDLLGPNLNQLRESVTTMSHDTTIELGCQMVSILEHIHKQGLVYRDVKPDNFLFPANCHLIEPEMIEVLDERGMPHIGYQQPSCEDVFTKWGFTESLPKLAVVDFGLVSWWRNPNTNKPYPESKKMIKNKTGTARYASLNVHRGKPHARRDDIESLGYLLLDLIFNGSLPWTGIQAKSSRIGWDKMRQIKEETLVDDLCTGLPRGLLEFIEYSRSLKFMDEPNYDRLRRFLRGSLGGGEYSDLVTPPSLNGGRPERKYVPEAIEKDPNTTSIASNSNRFDQHHQHPRKEQYYHTKPIVFNYNNVHFPNRDDSPSYHHHYQQQQQQRVPRQRRASYNHPRQSHDETGVFAMDDLHNTLPVVEQPAPLRPHSFNPQRGAGGFPRFREQPNHNNNNFGCNNNNRRSSREFNRPLPNISNNNHDYRTTKNRRRQKKVGWNSHKNDDAPWKPINADWETQKKPDINVTVASWDDHSDINQTSKKST
ncbi:kinase-like protein [Backusella circina FSU 941]|nr:kinase-like protein [Backusella circina FSU 941]